MNLRYVFGTASMAFLPWSIPCWILAAGAYQLTGISKDDESGDIALMVLFAPAFVPALVYDRVKCAVLNFKRGYYKNSSY